METIFSLIQTFLSIYLICIFVWALISWLPMISPSLAYNSTIVAIRKFLDSIVEPYIKLFRPLIPPIQAGGTMIDLSTIVAILVLIIVQNPILPALERALTGT